jgi:hypothetical protein
LPLDLGPANDRKRRFSLVAVPSREHRAQLALKATID